jgi:hypothetical protein
MKRLTMASISSLRLNEPCPNLETLILGVYDQDLNSNAMVHYLKSLTFREISLKPTTPIALPKLEYLNLGRLWVGKIVGICDWENMPKLNHL